MKLTNLSKKDFENILENYSIGKYKSHKYIFTGGNTIYKITTTKGKFIVKIYETASTAFVKYQIRLMKFLKKTKVSTPKIIDTKNKQGLLVWNKKRIAVQEFVRGKEAQYLDKELAKDLAKKCGLLDKILLKFKERQDSGWDDNQFKLVKWKTKNLFGMNLHKESKNLLKEIKKLNKKKLQRGLIHGDLCESNFLAENNKVTAIIDWDDAREDYLVYEVAVPIAHNLTTRKEARKEVIKTFMKEYQKHIKLNNEERKALYLFVKYRQLDGGLWSYNQIKQHRDRKDELMSWTKIMIQKYNTFNKLSLKEFLELLK